MSALGSFVVLFAQMTKEVWRVFASVSPSVVAAHWLVATLAIYLVLQLVFAAFCAAVRQPVRANLAAGRVQIFLGGTAVIMAFPVVASVLTALMQTARMLALAW